MVFIRRKKLKRHGNVRSDFNNNLKIKKKRTNISSPFEIPTVKKSNLYLALNKFKTNVPL